MNFYYLTNITSKNNKNILLESINRSWEIGRDSRNDIIIQDSWVSPHHALLLRVKEQHYLLNLSDINGTCHNGFQITGRVKLESGDFIKVGKTKLQFMICSSLA